MVQATPLGRTLSCLLCNVNAPVAASEGMWAVKFCSNKMLPFLTGGAG